MSINSFFSAESSLSNCIVILDKVIFRQATDERKISENAKNVFHILDNCFKESGEFTRNFSLNLITYDYFYKKF